MANTFDYKVILRDRLDQDMILESNRIQSFPSTWPYHDAKRSIENMAKAGFYYVREEVTEIVDGREVEYVLRGVRCFACRKTLTAQWNSNQNPWLEHSTRWGRCDRNGIREEWGLCPFARHQKPQSEFTVNEFIDLNFDMELVRCMQTLDNRCQWEKDRIRNEFVQLRATELSEQSSQEEEEGGLTVYLCYGK